MHPVVAESHYPGMALWFDVEEVRRQFGYPPSCDTETEFDSNVQFDGDPICKKCHPLCKHGCSGPLPDTCRDCKYFKRLIMQGLPNYFECTETCRQNEYEQNLICEVCHENCISGCSGPGDTEGPQGCRLCEKPILYETSEYRCLGVNDSCPRGSYLGKSDSLESKLKQYSGREGCLKCHNWCLECTGPGFRKEVCQLCAEGFESCSCGQDSYYDDVSKVCEKCSTECDGCTGLGADKCVNCKGFRFYKKHDTIANVSFLCVDSCPQSYSYDQHLEQYFCTDTNLTTTPAIANTTNITYLEVCFFVVCIVLVVLSAWLWSRGVTFKNDLRVQKILVDKEPLLPSSISPNLTKLKIVKEIDIKRIEILGEGCFGTVYRGFWLVDGGKLKVPVSVKVLNSGTDEVSTKEFLKEATVMAGFDHPNLLKLLAVCVTSNIMLVTQLLPMGDLLHHLRKQTKVTTPKYLLSWGMQIAQGMSYLEERRLVHRDLAARNVLIQSIDLVKIADFGLARALKIDHEAYAARRGKLPVKWTSLEGITQGIFNHKSDVWSFGVVVWEMLTSGKEPYGKMSVESLLKYLDSGERLPQPDCCSSDLYALLASCWAENPEHRPSFHELVEDFKHMSYEPERYIIFVSHYKNEPDPNSGSQHFYNEINYI